MFPKLNPALLLGGLGSSLVSDGVPPNLKTALPVDCCDSDVVGGLELALTLKVD